MVVQQIHLDGHKYQGADVLLFHRYHGEDTIVAFLQHNQRGPYVNVAGGRCESKHRDLEDTAAVELYEESRKSIFIASDVLRDMTARGSFVDYPGDNHHSLPGRRRCFVARVPHVSTTIYNENKRMLDSVAPSHRLAPYLETQAMVRIPVAALEASLKTGDSGHGRTVAGFYVSRFTVTAYLRAKTANLVKNAYNLSRVSYEQKENDNRDVTGLHVGRIDTYRF